MTTSRKTAILALTAITIATLAVIIGGSLRQRIDSHLTHATYATASQTTDSGLGVTFPDDHPIAVSVGSSGNLAITVSAYIDGATGNDVTVAIDGMIPRTNAGHLVFDIEGSGSVSGSAVLHVVPGHHLVSLRYFTGSALSATYQNRALIVSAV